MALSVAIVPIHVFAQQAGSGAAPQVSAPPSSTASESTYRLGVADKLRVIVFNEESLSGEFLVSDTGMLSLPLIGEVRAKGRTTAELVTEIQRRLADGYLRDPRVSLDILTYRPFYILGEVGKPGEYAYSAGLTVVNAVALAEGFTYRANKKRVFVRRAGEVSEHAEMLVPGMKVEPGDTIRIGERYF